MIYSQGNLTELRAFSSPVPGIIKVTAAVMCLMAPSGKVPKDRSWKAAKIMMAKVGDFIKSFDSIDIIKKKNLDEILFLLLSL